MRESTGNLWDAHQAGAWIVITTNGMTRRDGTAVMGAGLAKQAALRFPDLPRLLGHCLRESGNHVAIWPGYRLFTFPTKSDWRAPSELSLIERSAHELLQFVNGRALTAVYLPPPGCGLGQLQWAQVRPLLAPLFDDRFIVTVPPSR